MDPLTSDEISELTGLLRKMFTFRRQLVKEHPLASKIKAVQVPPALSESIAVLLIRQAKVLPELAGSQVQLDRRRADIIVTRDSRELRIEVKATGNKGFQRFRKKDIAADYLLWIHFDSYFESDGDEEILVYVITKPGKYFRNNQEVFVQSLSDNLGHQPAPISFRLSELT
ncbi:hypothetical protein CL628_04095 [bacterium]|nr:hypothetical protein [bacterium]